MPACWEQGGTAGVLNSFATQQIPEYNSQVWSHTSSCSFCFPFAPSNGLQCLLGNSMIKNSYTFLERTRDSCKLIHALLEDYTCHHHSNPRLPTLTLQHIPWRTWIESSVFVESTKRHFKISLQYRQIQFYSFGKLTSSNIIFAWKVRISCLSLENTVILSFSIIAHVKCMHLHNWDCKRQATREVQTVTSICQQALHRISRAILCL